MPHYILAQTTPPSTTPPPGAPAAPQPAPASTPAPAQAPPATTSGTATAPAAGAEQAKPPQGDNMLSFLFLMGALALFFYFLIYRPQKKQEKERNKMLSAVKKNDRVLTSGGIYGTVHTVREKDIILKIDDNTKVRFAKSAIVAVEQASAETTSEEQPDSAKAQNN